MVVEPDLADGEHIRVAAVAFQLLHHGGDLAHVVLPAILGGDADGGVDAGIGVGKGEGRLAGGEVCGGVEDADDTALGSEDFFEHGGKTALEFFREHFVLIVGVTIE